MSRRVILFELNEVPWKVVDDYASDHPDSALAHLLARATGFTSMAADRGHLSPWTTWPTLHRGVNDELHMIASFGQDHEAADAAYPPIWTLLQQSGVSVGICGTLHSFPVPTDMASYSFYLPDAFATEPVAVPSELATFQRFNLKMSRESARNVDTGIPIKEAVRVLKKSPSLGIRPQTYAALAGQLVAERRHPWKSNRRRTLQSVLAFDLYMKQLQRSEPEFSSFFTNHVASAMHRYWAASYPGDYDELNLDDAWMQTYRQEVPWAMGQADAMLGRLTKFVDAHPSYQLWIASSMGQFATRAQSLETQVFCTKLPKFMEALGLPSDHGWAPRPAMLPQCNVTVDEEFREDFEAGLKKLKIGGRRVRYKRTDTGFFSMDFGQNNLHDKPRAVVFAGKPRKLASMGLEAVEIEDRSDTTAYHVPEGVLAIYDPTDTSAKGPDRPEISVLAVAPALLKNFGVQPPSYMEPEVALSHAVFAMSTVPPASPTS